MEYTITVLGSDVELTKEQMPEEIAVQLENIAQRLREGFTSGFNPSWDLEIK